MEKKIHFAFECLRDVPMIVVAGCGGTGSRLVTYLAELHYGLRCLGHSGFRVCVYDPDTVSDNNIGRQKFYPCDIGLNKAEVLINRINACYGLYWKGKAEQYDSQHEDILIGCVDSRRSRASLINGLHGGYYLDCGNAGDYGQVLIGNGKDMPYPHELYPELFDPALDSPDDGPSCSMAEALARQKLFVNAHAALYAAEILRCLFMDGQIDYQGVFFNRKEVRRLEIARLRDCEIAR